MRLVTIPRQQQYWRLGGLDTSDAVITAGGGEVKQNDRRTGQSANLNGLLPCCTWPLVVRDSAVYPYLLALRTQPASNGLHITMDWYYSIGEKPKGPIPEDQFRTLLKTGTVGPDTLVWREGLSAWQAYGALAGNGPNADLQTVWCAECGNLTAQEAAIRFEGYYVCAACKPDFVQKMKEGILLPRLGLWRQRRLVILSRAGRLADRCLRCNAPASHAFKRKLRWYPQWLSLIMFCLCLPLAPLAFFVGRKATVEVGLCRRHYLARRRTLLLGALAILSFLIILIVGIYTNHGGMVLIAIALAGMSLLMSISASLVNALHIDERYIHLQGADGRFLKSLPPWPERH